MASREEGLPEGQSDLCVPPLVLLKVVPCSCQSDQHDEHEKSEILEPRTVGIDVETNGDANVSMETLPITGAVASRIPYVVSALSNQWGRHASDREENRCSTDGCRGACDPVQVFMPTGCPPEVLRALVGRLAVDVSGNGLAVHWQPTDLVGALQLVQVASMLQLEEFMPELISLVREAVGTVEDVSALEAACHRLEFPAALRDAAATLRPGLEPAHLPDEAQVRGMIASALLTADGKVWRVVQKVIDRREAWPRLAKENAAVLLAFATGEHGSIRATPHTGFFWGSRDFLYLVCRYVRQRPEHFDSMVSAMFDSVYSMDPELPAEIIDAVFKELLVHEGLSFGQCEHVIAKLMQREDQLDYLFHEWSGMFPMLPGNARCAVAKGLLPAVGCCPHTALDFVLKELDTVPTPSGRGSFLNAIRRASQRVSRTGRRGPTSAALPLQRQWWLTLPLLFLILSVAQFSSFRTHVLFYS